MGVFSGPEIRSNDLVLALDAGNTQSYVGTGVTWRDLSGRGNNGTLTNGPTYSSADGGSIVFDGVNDYVDCGTVSTFAFGVGGFAINLWFNVASNSSGVNDWICLVSQGAYSSGSGNFTILLNRDPLNVDYKNIRTYINGSSVITTTLDSSGIIPNKWYNYTVTRNSSTVSAYVSGQFSNSVTNSSSISATNSFWIGIGPTPGSLPYPIDGKIPIVQVYNKGLTAAEVSQNFNALRGRFGI